MSHLEHHFLMQLRAHELPEPERERRVHWSRRFRYDFAWPELKLAVEIEGGAPEKGHHHTSRKGYLSDCRKYNLALSCGWRVLRFTARQVKSGEALMWTRFLLQRKTLPDGRPKKTTDAARRADWQAREEAAALGRPQATAGRAIDRQDQQGRVTAAHGSSGVHEAGLRGRGQADPRQDPAAREGARVQ